ncbi:increased DNA methylation 3-like [Daucus carota subsp. sativus]|nr:PREDICTED: increased DNA methylation 3-like [Daucus carota subsp. sativus]
MVPKSNSNMSTNLGTGNPLLKPVVTKTGTASKGTVGASLGKVDISASEKAYSFQVALAGVCGNQSNMKCSVRDDGRVKIEGVVTDSSLRSDGVLYEVKVQEFSPPGPFSISFDLPGPVDPRLTAFDFKHGILDATVMKFRIPYFPNNH